VPIFIIQFEYDGVGQNLSVPLWMERRTVDVLVTGWGGGCVVVETRMC